MTLIVNTGSDVRGLSDEEIRMNSYAELGKLSAILGDETQRAMATKRKSEVSKAKHDAATPSTPQTPATTSPEASRNPSTPSVPRRRQRADPAAAVTPSSLKQLVSTPSTGSLSRSSTRSGRPYLPEDTGIPSSDSSRKRSRAATVGSPNGSSQRRRFFATSSGNPSTRSRRVSAVLIPTLHHGGTTPSTLDLANPIASSKTQNEPCLELDPSGHEAPLHPRPSTIHQNFISAPVSKAQEQLTTPTTDNNPLSSSSHHRRGATQNDLLGVQKDTDEWVKANLGPGHQKLPPSIVESEASPTSYASGGFFEDLYELTMQTRAAT
ncbi:MAG: hypothetical protein Q9181_005716 [Wetmoreana brouardii]